MHYTFSTVYIFSLDLSRLMCSYAIFHSQNHKRGSNFSYLDCYTPKLLWRPRRGGWQVPRMGESTGNFWYFTLFHPAPYSNYVYWVILIFGGPFIKEGLILVILIVTLQNYHGDLGEVCGKYPGWVKVPGPFDILPFFTQFPILFTYRFWGSRYKRGSNYSYLDCYTPKLFWQPWWGMWKEPRMGESTGTFLYLPLFHPAPYSIYAYWDILGFFFGGGGRHKRGSNFSYLDCYTPKLFWRPSWGVWQVPSMGESTGTFWYFTLFIQLPIMIMYIEIYWFLGARYKRGSNFSYLDCYTPKLLWRPRWGMWQVPRMGESIGIFLYLSLFLSSSLFYIRLLRHMGFGGPVIKEGLILVISIVTLQNYYGDLGEVCVKYPGWVKVPGPFDICHFFTQLSILFTHIDIYICVLGGPL